MVLEISSAPFSFSRTHLSILSRLPTLAAKTIPMRFTKGLYFFLFLVACYFLLFLHLDSQALHLWDESRRAVSAFEMVQNGNWLVPMFEGQPDMYGTKPALLVALQAFFMTFLGYNELAVRLPSVLAALATVFMLIHFAKQWLRLPFAGYLGSLVLLTSLMYINYHGAVSGDYDALLCLWTTAYALSYYKYLESFDKKYIYYTGLFVALACLTKSIAGLFFAPGLIVYTLFRRQFQEVIRKADLYYAATGSIALILSYYFLREIYHPGYLHAVWMNEIYGRYFAPQEGHTHDVWYYLRHTYESKGFHPWVFFLPFAFIIGYFNEKTKAITQLILINALVFLWILSNGGTKLEWYPLPIIPSLSFLIGIALAWLWEHMRSLVSLPYQPILAGLFILAIFAQPYGKIVQRHLNNTPLGWDGWLERYRDAMEAFSDEKTYTVLHSRYNGHVVFYKKIWNHQGHNIRQHILHPPAPHVQATGFSTGRLNFPKGQKLLMCEGEAFDRIRETYEYKEVRWYRKCQMWEIIGPK